MDWAEAGAFPFLDGAVATGGVIDVFAISGNTAAVLDANQADSFRFLTLDFLALAPTQVAPFAIDLGDVNLLFLNSGGGDLSVVYGGSSATVRINQPGGQVPELGTIMLFAIGSCGIAAFVRRRYRDIS